VIRTILGVEGKARRGRRPFPGAAVALPGTRGWASGLLGPSLAALGRDQRPNGPWNDQIERLIYS